MNFTYKFPAVRGRQANNDYYVAMIPLSLLDKLFVENINDVLPDQRAQRRINETRIPIIRDYIIQNRNNYVFSALCASIDGDFKFVETATNNTGILEIDMNSIFLINDGQHRKAALLDAIKEDNSLLSETISIVFFQDKGLARSQQMFADLNKHAVKTSNSLATLYDYRDQLAVTTKNIVDNIEFFRNFTDKERDILGKNSSNLFTLTTIYKSNKRIFRNANINKKDEIFLQSYWQAVCENIVEWNELLNKELSKKCLRENYITTLAITINAFGRLGHYFYINKEKNFKKILIGLQKINWLRSNKEWLHRTISEKGKVINSDVAVILTCAKIKDKLGIQKDKEEILKEQETFK